MALAQAARFIGMVGIAPVQAAFLAILSTALVGMVEIVLAEVAFLSTPSTALVGMVGIVLAQAALFIFLPFYLFTFMGATAHPTLTTGGKAIIFTIF